MTRERALELARETSPTTMYVDVAGKPYRGAASAEMYLDRIADAILAAVAEENEMCAKIADTPVWTDEESVCATIAGQIRDRASPCKGAA